MNYYKTSNGERVSKAVIDRRVRNAKKQLLENQLSMYDYNFCEECKEYPEEQKDTLEYKILDCSHIESADSCQKHRRSEKAWDLDNIRILCRFHHRKHDKTNLF